MTAPLLVADGLCAGYSSVPVVFDISLRIDAGEIVALLGANGAGKSTILRALTGLLRPSQGRVVFDGRDITGMPAEEIVPLGLSHVAENRQIFRAQTVRENLDLGTYFLRLSHADRAERQEQALSLFPALKQKLDQTSGMLSGGQQQMLAIAQALMRRPRLILLDEPSIGLAPLLVEEVFQAIEAVRRKGQAILLVEQVVERTLESADRAYLLQNGRMVASGPADALAESGVVGRAYMGEKIEQALHFDTRADSGASIHS